MKNIRFFLSEKFHFLAVTFSVYLNRHVFVMEKQSWIFCLIVLNSGAISNFPVSCGSFQQMIAIICELYLNGFFFFFFFSAQP